MIESVMFRAQTSLKLYIIIYNFLCQKYSFCYWGCSGTNEVIRVMLLTRWIGTLLAHFWHIFGTFIAYKVFCQ